MSQHPLQKHITGEEELTPRPLVESLAIALLLVAGLFVLANLLLLPVIPV